MTARGKRLHHSPAQNSDCAVGVGPGKVFDIRSWTGLMFSHKPGHGRTGSGIRQTRDRREGEGKKPEDIDLFSTAVPRKRKKTLRCILRRLAWFPLNNLAIRKFENDWRRTAISGLRHDGVFRGTHKNEKKRRGRVEYALEAYECERTALFL